MHRLPYTVLRSNGEIIESRNQWHPMVESILGLAVARMLAAHVPVWHVAKEVDAEHAVPVEIRDSVHALSSDATSVRHVEHILETVHAESRIWQRQEVVQVVRQIDGIPPRIHKSVMHMPDVLELRRQHLFSERRISPQQNTRLKSSRICLLIRWLRCSRDAMKREMQRQAWQWSPELSRW